jgi:hypothetical protein
MEIERAQLAAGLHQMFAWRERCNYGMRPHPVLRSVRQTSSGDLQGESIEYATFLIAIP